MASQVVDILMQRGRDAAAADIARGQAWSGAVQSLAAIPGQMVEQKQRQTALDLQTQKAKREQEAFDQAQQGQKNAAALVAGLPKNDDGTIDTATLMQQAGQKNIPLDQLEHLTNTIDGVNRITSAWNETKRKHQQEEIDHYADLADTIQAAHSPKDPVTWDSIHAAMEAARSGGMTISDDEQQKAVAAEAKGVDPGLFLKAIRSQGSKYKDEKPLVLKRGERAFQGDEQIAEGAPEPQTEVELALKAAGNDPTKAMGLLKPSSQAQGTPEQQYLKALTDGDQKKADLILAAIKKTKEAAAGTTEDVGTQADTRTTATGRQYVDLSKYKGKDYQAALREAHKAGVFPASAAESDALANIETARQNMDLIEKSIGKLPSSALSRGPNVPLLGPIGPGALANRFEANTQMDPDLAAWGTYRTAAIQAMRALAGSKGLRINKSEIETSMANDIPEITDTQATAKEKFDRVRKMLENQENGVMGKPGETRGQALRQEVPGHPGTFAVSHDGGKSWQVE